MRCDAGRAMVDVSALENDNFDHHRHEHDGHNDSHSEIAADYRFSCTQGAKLTSITVEQLEYFPGIKEMNVMWITDAGQGAVKLNAGATRIQLR